MSVNILKIINKIKNTDFDELPEPYKDMDAINNGDKREKFKSILSRQYDPIWLVREISRRFNISEAFACGMRGVRNPGLTLLRIIKEVNPLERYNLIPTFSMLPIYIRKEDSVIPIYNDALLSYIMQNKDKNGNIKGVSNISFSTDKNIFIFPDSGSRMSLTKTIPTIAGFLSKIHGTENVNKLSNLISENKVYIINCVALNRQTLMYYPSDRLEYDKESIYDFIGPKYLFLLSSGLENIESSVFIKTALSIRHSVSSEDKKTFIETPMSIQEISKIYGLNKINCEII